jgi:hypothetical protein
MYALPAPFTDNSLLLQPRWTGFGQAALLLVLLLGAVTLVIWLYRTEMRIVSRSAAVGLLGLRLAVVLALFFLVSFQPIWARTIREVIPGRVLIAVDRSESMDVTDPQRPARDKLRLARALKLAGDLCSDAQLDNWIRQHDEKPNNSEWVAAEDVPRSPESRQVHDQVCQRVDALLRSQTARRLLEDDGGNLFKSLRGPHDVELLGFAQDLWAPVEHVEDLFLTANQEDAKPGNSYSRAFTDLRAPLAHALERSGPDQARVLGVVLLTDGQHNWGTSPAAKALELGEHKLPIFPVALGARGSPPDIAVINVKAPPAVFKDVEATIEVRLKVSGIKAQDIHVRVHRPPPPRDETLDQVFIHHDGADAFYTKRFQVRLDQPGSQTLLVTAKPENEATKETRSDNNSQAFVINVADDKARVLLIDGEARWEYHYLANALARDRTVQVQSVLFAQPRLGRISEEELRDIGHPRQALPAEADALAGYDCIVLGDVTADQLPPAERVRLEKFVADRGGTLVIVAGKRAMPSAFADNDQDPLAKLLPIETPRVLASKSGFRVTLTHDGKQTPFLQLDSAPEQSESRWRQLPSHYWGVVGRAKPGAAVLATPFEKSDEKQPAADERDRALIVRQNYGFGRVLFVGLDSTWRWRFREGDTYHHRFWGQVIRWAAADKPLVSGNEFVRFGTRDAVYQQGQEVDLVVRLGEELGGRTLPADALAGARILRRSGDKEEAVALVPLHRKEAQPRVLEGRLRDLPAGQYAVELAIPELADKLNGPPGPDGTSSPLRAAFTVMPPESDEKIELATNWPLLEELAAKSGGKVFTPENAAELVDLLTQQAATRTERVDTPLWQWWGTLVVLLALLTAEWVWRKLVGLP